jgi:hypothetical protein
MEGLSRTRVQGRSLLKIRGILLLVALLSGPVIGDGAAQRSSRKMSARPGLPAGHPERERSRAEELEKLTQGANLALPASPAGPAIERNFIDERIFQKARQDKVPLAALCSDAEFLRRVSLDLTGRLPGPERIRAFLKNTSPQKREELVDEILATSTKGVTKKPSSAFLDRWTYFFCDLFRVNNLMNRGRTLFRDHIYNFLLTNQPYDEFVRGLLTASSESNFNSGPVNFLVRFYVDQPDQSTVNPEDTYDELAIRTTRMFLGVNLECISCHAGAGHLEKINLWLTGKEREAVWRQAAFFSKIRLYRPYGDLVDEFVLSNEGKGYDTASKSVLRIPRHPAQVSPRFILTDEPPKADEDPRQALARMMTGHPQFARTLVNLVWAELFGIGIVDPPLDFDLARYGVQPPAPWSPQTQHAELLDALARDFEAHRYNLRHLIRRIVTSSTYQLSHRLEAPWKPSDLNYFTRRLVRRLPAEQIWDALSDASGIYPELNSGDFGLKVKYAQQTVSPEDFEPKLRKFLASFGLDDRTLGVRSLGGSIVQASQLMNSDIVKAKLQAEPGSRLQLLFSADPPKTNAEIVEELFLSALGRFPAPAEAELGCQILEERHLRGAQDLLWVLVNKPEFQLNY